MPYGVCNSNWTSSNRNYPRCVEMERMTGTWHQFARERWKSLSACRVSRIHEPWTFLFLSVKLYCRMKFTSSRGIFTCCPLQNKRVFDIEPWIMTFCWHLNSTTTSQQTERRDGHTVFIYWKHGENNLWRMSNLRRRGKWRTDGRYSLWTVFDDVMLVMMPILHNMNKSLAHMTTNISTDRKHGTGQTIWNKN